MALLEIDRLSVAYGAVTAVHDVSLTLDEGEVVALIGANGAGKTTTLRAIAGVTPHKAGSIRFDGQRLDGLQPHEIVRRGISLTPEGRALFPRMTVRENLEMGAYTRKDTAEVRRDWDRVLALLPRLAERLDQRAGTLSGGEQQMAAIGRALMARPRLLLLDEPSMGLAPLLVQTVFRALLEINRQGTPLLLVEQNAQIALALAHRGYVLHSGRVALEGPSATLREQTDVAGAYLGTSPLPLSTL